ncbi:MAG TPA: hypothetical protein VK017_06465 [Sphingobacterium sp.]|nr:hypothetical protein [Sphingobacterium sp.]
MEIRSGQETMMATDASTLLHNKKVPRVIQRQLLAALSHYPELHATNIRFVFTQTLRKSVMAARPVVRTLLRGKKHRVYDILISPVFKLRYSIEPIHQVDDSVLIGWIGHELGHILDYEMRSVWGIARFGLLYLLSKRYIRRAERTADTFAVQRGMGDYILATKQFILDHSEFPQRYKDRIANLYLSPDDIVELVSSLEGENSRRQEEILDTEVKTAGHPFSH